MKAQNTITMSTQLGSNMSKLQSIQAKEQLNVKSKITIKKDLQIVYRMEKNCAYIQITLYKDFFVSLPCIS
jgi:hypothetical protein